VATVAPLILKTVRAIGVLVPSISQEIPNIVSADVTASGSAFSNYLVDSVLDDAWRFRSCQVWNTGRFVLAFDPMGRRILAV
jgi:hypothetical protein